MLQKLVFTFAKGENGMLSKQILENVLPLGPCFILLQTPYTVKVKNIIALQLAFQMYAKYNYLAAAISEILELLTSIYYIS